MTQPQMQDPTILAAQAAMAETQRKAQADQAKAQLDSAKIADKDKERAVEMQAEQFKQDQENQRTSMEVEARVGMNNADNQTARDLAMMEIASGERVAVSTGTGVNPSP
jgi:multidrug efflux pump subunit AcrA (membrane-fusion protein)